MVGLNNALLVGDSAGVAAILAAIRVGQPGAKVLFPGVLPAFDAGDPVRAWTAEFNARAANLADGTAVRFHDPGADVLTAAGDRKPGLYDPDSRSRPRAIINARTSCAPHGRLAPHLEPTVVRVRLEFPDGQLAGHGVGYPHRPMQQKLEGARRDEVGAIGRPSHDRSVLAVVTCGHSGRGKTLQSLQAELSGIA